MRRTRPRSCSLRCRRAGANVGSCRTDSKRDKIKDLLDYIQERLDELEEEKEELKQFQVRPCSTLSAPCPDVPDGLLPPADARPLAPLARVLHLPARAAGRRRHARPDRGGAPARRRQRQLEAGGVQRAREGAVGASPSASSTSIPTRSAPADSLLRAQTLAARLSTLRESLSTLSTEHRELSSEKRDLAKAVSSLECTVADAEDAARSGAERRTSAEAALERVEGDIAAKEGELAALLPDWESARADEAATQDEVEQAEVTLRQLFAKQGRRGQFRTRRERDEHLSGLVVRNEATLEQRRGREEGLEREKEATEKERDEAEAQRKLLREQADGRRDRVHELKEEIAALKKAHADKDEQRRCVSLFSLSLRGRRSRLSPC